MNKKHLFLFIIYLFATVSLARVTYYELRFGDIQRPIMDKNLGSPVKNSQVKRALDYLNESSNVRVFTFRQSDIANQSGFSWMDNFDPRATAFYKAKTNYELFVLLKKSEITHILVPPYSLPTEYESRFQKLLSDINYVRPVFANLNRNKSGFFIQDFQLYELLPNANQTSRSNCKSVFAKNTQLWSTGPSGIGRALSIFTSRNIAYRYSPVANVPDGQIMKNQTGLDQYALRLDKLNPERAKYQSAETKPDYIQIHAKLKGKGMFTISYDEPYTVQMPNGSAGVRTFLSQASDENGVVSLSGMMKLNKSREYGKPGFWISSSDDSTYGAQFIEAEICETYLSHKKIIQNEKHQFFPKCQVSEIELQCTKLIELMTSRDCRWINVKCKISLSNNPSTNLISFALDRVSMVYQKGTAYLNSILGKNKVQNLADKTLELYCKPSCSNLSQVRVWITTENNNNYSLKMNTLQLFPKTRGVLTLQKNKVKEIYKIEISKLDVSQNLHLVIYQRN